MPDYRIDEITEQGRIVRAPHELVAEDDAAALKLACKPSSSWDRFELWSGRRLVARRQPGTT